MNEQNARALRLTARWLVGLHFLTVVLHSVAHEVLRVRASAAQLAFIVPFIIVAPPVAGVMLSKSARAGATLLLASMLGSFLFGLYYHFVADTIDHVAHVARMQPALGAATFRATAYLLLVSEAAGATAAALMLARQTRTLRPYAARTDF